MWSNRKHKFLVNCETGIFLFTFSGKYFMHFKNENNLTIITILDESCSRVDRVEERLIYTATGKCWERDRNSAILSFQRDFAGLLNLHKIGTLPLMLHQLWCLCSDKTLLSIDTPCKTKHMPLLKSFTAGHKNTTMYQMCNSLSTRG